MKAEDGVSRHPGITIHKMPVAGTVGGFIFAVGIVVLAVVGLPFAKWFLLGAVILGLQSLAVCDCSESRIRRLK